MKKLSLLAFFFLALVVNALDVDSSWRIVVCNGADASIQYSGKLLSEQLGRSFGKSPSIVEEKEWDGKAPAIFLGWSQKNKALRQDASRKWSDEEWTIRQAAPKLIQISGAPIRGTFHGTLEFLERFAGYRAYAIDLEYIDKKSALALPEKLNLTGKPFFPYRTSSIGVYSNNPFWLNNRSAGAPMAETGWYTLTGQPHGVHTFNFYSKDFDNDEYYSLSEQGVRQKAVGAHGPGQICMSHPGARKAVAKKLLEVIRKEREEIDKTRQGTGYPKIYSLSVNDTPAYCHCAGCKALHKKYGAISGAQLEFLNAIAQEVAKEYPDVMIMGEAYEFLAEPPKNIKARDNVLIRIALLGKEFANVGNRDCMLPLTHPANAVPAMQFKGWANVAKNLAVWDYGRIYVEPVSLPYTTVRAHAADVRYYSEIGVIYSYVEGEFHEGGRVALQSFVDLEHYVHLRMLLDPTQDVEALIKDYMQKYYGAAEPQMAQLLSYLEKRMAEDPDGFSGKNYQQRKYLDKDLAIEADRLLTAAEEAVRNDPERLARVRQERLPFDSLMLNKRDLNLLNDQGGPFDRTTVAKRWKEVADAVVMKYCFEQYYRPQLTRSALLKSNEMCLTEYLNPVKLPDFLKDAAIVVDCTTTNFMSQNNRYKVVADSDATGGKAIIYTGKDFRDAPFEIGLYEQKLKKTIDKKVIFMPAQDEKYHWCKFSNVRLTENLRMWGHASWGMTPILLNKFYDPRNPEQLYDIYFSFKLEGPSFVKDSTKPYGCYMDRIIITHANDNIEPPAANVVATVEPPDFLRNVLNIADFTAANFEPQSATCRIVPEKDALLGMALSYTGGKHEQPLEFGVYDNERKYTVRRLTISEPPQDERFHWYKMDNIKLGQKTRMWGHYTWGFTPIKLEKVFDTTNPNRLYDIYISCKLQGPAYVKGSNKPNGCFIDRIVITVAAPEIKP